MSFIGNSIASLQNFSEEFRPIQDAQPQAMLHWEADRVAERQLMRSKGMDILRRGVPAAEGNTKEISPDRTVHQRVEVTVEREVVSILVRGQPKDGAQQPAGGGAEPEAAPPKLPAPLPATDNPATDNKDRK
jgi:hypothetical protein